MARKPSARVVLNRSRVNRVRLGLADGVGALAAAIIDAGDPPDATPFGEGLVTRGGWLAYVGDKKVGGGGTDGRQPRKPRAVRVRGTAGILAVAGWGFPARFQVYGTIYHPPQDFFTPSIRQVIPTQVDPIMRSHLRPWLRG